MKKSSRGHTEIDEASYTENNIGNFCLRPYVVHLSPKTARVTVMAYPMMKEDFEAQHNLYNNPSFPGLELMVCDVDIFPLVSPDLSKAWGCPLIPLLYLSGDKDDHSNIPSTDDIKAAI